MKIDKRLLNRYIWYEDENGNEVKTDPNVVNPKNQKIRTYHTMFPLEVSETLYSYNPETEKTEYIARFTSSIGGGNQDVILAMANSGDYTLSEAIMLWANCCERCMNVLAYKYLNGKDGYPEYSEEWKKCNTVCKFCEDEK